MAPPLNMSKNPSNALDLKNSFIPVASTPGTGMCAKILKQAKIAKETRIFFLSSGALKMFKYFSKVLFIKGNYNVLNMILKA